MMAIEGGEENPAVIEPASKVFRQPGSNPHGAVLIRILRAGIGQAYHGENVIP
jgi:hypothetical protein